MTKSKRGRPIYSPLHNFVNKEKRKEEIKDEPDLLGGSATKENTKSKGLHILSKYCVLQASGT